jgi:mRNA interferase MazF
MQIGSVTLQLSDRHLAAEDYPFEVHIPAGLAMTGAVLADQVRSLDWRARQATFTCHLPEATVAEVLHKRRTLL